MILAGKKFTSIREAFEYFVKEIYPTFPPEEVKKLKVIVSRFKNGYSLTDRKKEEVLEKYGKAKIKKNIIISFI